MTNFFLILLAFGLVLLNGFFVAAEFAIVKMRQTQVQAIKQGHGVRGRLLAAVHEHIDAYLSACQLGITLASLGLGWVGEPAFARLLSPLLNIIGITSDKAITFIAFFIAFSVISFLHIVVGELAPKSMAIRKPATVSLWTAAPLYSFYWLMYPAILILNKSANLVLRLFKLDETSEKEGSYSAKELKLILTASHRHGELHKEEAQILERALNFRERRVADCMQPMDEMVGIYLTKPLSEILKTISQYRFSRYPVFSGEDDEKILGVMHIKDLLRVLQRQGSIDDIKALLRPVVTVEPNVSALELFRAFQAGMTHFALVVGAGEKSLGFVTLDDILITLLGNIQDEFNQPKPDWKVAPDGAFLMKGNTPLYIIEKALNIEISEQDINTIGGLIMAKLDRMPEASETIEFEQFKVVIARIKGPKILSVKVYPKQRELR